MQRAVTLRLFPRGSTGSKNSETRFLMVFYRIRISAKAVGYRFFSFANWVTPSSALLFSRLIVYITFSCYFQNGKFLGAQVPRLFYENLTSIIAVSLNKFSKSEKID